MTIDIRNSSLLLNRFNVENNTTEQIIKRHGLLRSRKVRNIDFHVPIEPIQLIFIVTLIDNYDSSPSFTAAVRKSSY